MSLLVVGCNHRSASLALLERLAVPGEQLPKALADVMSLEHVTEAVIVSTCNRVEVYAQVTRFHLGLQEVRGWLAARGDVHPQDLDEVQYSFHDERAAAHLFSVAGGLDSMVIGERQIAGQVKQAMEVARAEGSARRVLQRLFRQAITVGRRVRSESAIGEGASSMVDVGLAAVAARRQDDLVNARVAILGAGELGGLAVARLAEGGARTVTVWNRSPDKAVRLGSKLAGRIPYEVEDALVPAIVDADVVVCTTGATEPVLDLDVVTRALAERDGAAGSLVLLDLGVPRNVDPACGSLPGVELIDVSDVRQVADQGRAGELLAEARVIVDEEAARFATWTRASEVEPAIRAFRDYAEEIRQSELARLDKRLSSLDRDERAAVDAATRRIVNTLLHQPTVRLKELAEAGGAHDGVELVRDLFDLPDDEG
ncbi:MAG: glutamyl-tRNA reductase [Nitriliruptoraceae bacterium]